MQRFGPLVSPPYHLFLFNYNIYMVETQWIIGRVVVYNTEADNDITIVPIEPNDDETKNDMTVVPIRSPNNKWVEMTPKEEPSKGGATEALRYAVLEKYPGLKPIDPADMDLSLPVITINSMDELTNFMAGVSAVRLYEEG